MRRDDLSTDDNITFAMTAIAIDGRVPLRTNRTARCGCATRWISSPEQAARHLGCRHVADSLSWAPSSRYHCAPPVQSEERRHPGNVRRSFAGRMKRISGSRGRAQGLQNLLYTADAGLRRRQTSHPVELRPYMSSAAWWRRRTIRRGHGSPKNSDGKIGLDAKVGVWARSLPISR